MAGSATLAFGSRADGVLLAFSAILAASLTLIAREEDRNEAREDAHGAILGAVALIVFAAIAAAGFTHLAAPLVLAGATIAWLTVSILGYVVLWRPGRWFGARTKGSELTIESDLPMCRGGA